MSTISVDVRYRSLPLSEPYWLAFGPVEAFDTFIVRAETSQGVGFSEVTPLPGYSFESSESVRAEFEALASGSARSLVDVIAAETVEAPMAASGIASACDTLTLSNDEVFGAHKGESIPCVALCGGGEPEALAARARQLTDEGYRVLKVKIGSDVELDLARVNAVSEVLPEGVRFRVDANQQMSMPDTLTFVKGAVACPIELVEQPFKPEADNDMRKVREVSELPLMLDESIWTRDDIDRAADLGMDYVKLKLCKHPGICENIALIEHARALGLNVVYGNGVQGPVGNRQEAFVYLESGLETAIESIGFKKIAETLPSVGMRVEDGNLVLEEATDPAEIFEAADPIATIKLSA